MDEILVRPAYPRGVAQQESTMISGRFRRT
jgi:hypothetical protein